MGVGGRQTAANVVGDAMVRVHTTVQGVPSAMQSGNGALAMEALNKHFTELLAAFQMQRAAAEAQPGHPGGMDWDYGESTNS